MELPDYKSRMASIESKLVAISKDPEYAKLNPDAKVYLRNELYNRYVVPTYQDANLTPPSRKDWLRGTIDVSHLDPSEQFYTTINLGPGKIETTADWAKTGIRIGENFFSGSGELIDAGVKKAHNVWNEAYTKAYNYAYPAEGHYGPEYKGAWGDGFNKYVQNSFGWAENKLERSNDIDNYWTDSHPANTYTQKLMGAGGYMLGQLPFYEALGSALKAGGLAVGGLPAIGPLVTNVTEALNATKKGQFVAKTLMGAAQGYLFGAIKQEDTKGKLEEAGQWAAMEMIFGVAGLAGMAGINAIKRGLAPVGDMAEQFMAKVIAYGGKPLMQSMFDGAMKDAFDGHLGIEIHPSRGAEELTAAEIPRVGVDRQHIWTPLRAKDTMDIEIGSPHSHMLGDVAVSPHSTFPQAGHLTFDGKIYPYSNLQEMQQQYNYLADIAEARRAKADPVLHQTNAATEKILRDLSWEMFGHRAIKRLTNDAAKGKEEAKSQLAQLMARFSEHMHNAVDKVAVYAPEVVEEEQEQAIQAYNKNSPDAAEFDARFKKAGVAPAKAITKSITETAKKRSGMKNADKTVEQVAAVRNGIKANRTVKLPKEYEPPEGATVGFGLEEALGKEGLANLKKARLENLGTLDDAIQQGKAYLKNPANKGYIPQERRAADGTLIGKRDKRSWQERMSDINTADFVKSLPLAKGLDFENGGHKILFHWGNRGLKEGETDSTKGLTRKMAFELRKEFETPDRKLTYADFDRASDLLGRHLIQLAKANKLEANGTMKIFNSSNFFDQPTVWQAELNGDVEKMEYGLLNHMLSNYPDVLAAMNATMEGFQNKRAATYSVDDWLRYNRMIDTLMTGEITPEMKAEMAAMGY